MALFLCILFFFISSASACNRCVHQTKVVYFSSDSTLSSGACGYDSLATSFYGPHLAAAVPSIYKDGAGCGACFQIRCKDAKLCSKHGTKVIVTDLNQDNRVDFVMSSSAFMSMANKGMSQDVLKLGIVDVEYKRIPCDYETNNLAIRVEESSKMPNYLAIKLLYQGGQIEIRQVDVAQVDPTNWVEMSRSYGAIWDTSKVPKGALKFRFVLTAGYDARGVMLRMCYLLTGRLGRFTTLGVQINDIAQEICFPCDDGS